MEEKRHTVHPLEHPIHRARAPPARHLDVEMVVVRCSGHCIFVRLSLRGVVFYSSICPVPFRIVGEIGGVV